MLAHQLFTKNANHVPLSTKVGALRMVGQRTRSTHIQVISSSVLGIFRQCSVIARLHAGWLRKGEHGIAFAVYVSSRRAFSRVSHDADRMLDLNASRVFTVPRQSRVRSRNALRIHRVPLMTFTTQGRRTKGFIATKHTLSRTHSTTTTIDRRRVHLHLTHAILSQCFNEARIALYLQMNY